MLHFKQVQEQIECIHNDWRAWLDIAGGETWTSETDKALKDPERAGSGIDVCQYLALVHWPTRHNHTKAFIVSQSSTDYHQFSFFPRTKKIDSSHTIPEGPGLQTRLRWIKPGLWAQPYHSLCLEYLWQVYN